MQEIEIKTNDLTKTDEMMETAMQYRSMETYLRFRGTAEKSEEVIRCRMVEILVQYLNQEQ